MSLFALYFKLGLRHILDIFSVQHVLFIIALTAIFLFKDWKRILILIASFTLGYSLTMYLSVYGVIQPDQRLIDYLIPLTIFLTAVSNIIRKKDNFHIRGNFQRNYLLALLFGFIHGFGFAHYVKGIINNPNPSVTPVFAYNLGLEFGQAVVVFGFLFLAFIFVGIIGINRKDWVLIISSAIAGVALTMMFESKYW